MVWELARPVDPTVPQGYLDLLSVLCWRPFKSADRGECPNGRLQPYMNASLSLPCSSLVFAERRVIQTKGMPEHLRQARC